MYTAAGADIDMKPQTTDTDLISTGDSIMGSLVRKLILKMIITYTLG